MISLHLRCLFRSNLIGHVSAWTVDRFRCERPCFHVNSHKFDVFRRTGFRVPKRSSPLSLPHARRGSDLQNFGLKLECGKQLETTWKLLFYLQFLEIVHMTLSISKNCPLQDFQAIANGNTSGSDEALSQ